MNRGSAAYCFIQSRSDWSFNEAPIHESGKFGLTADDFELDGRFNEAPIHESGKYYH